MADSSGSAYKEVGRNHKSRCVIAEEGLDVGQVHEFRNGQPYREYEMEELEKKSCAFEEMIFSHGLRRCDDGRCVVCNDGDWVNPLELSSPSSRQGIYVAPGKDLSEI